MIEDKELGLKVAENEDVAFWTETKKKCNTSIKSCEREIEINKYLLNLCETKINGS